MKLRKILSTAIVACLLITQVASLAYANEVPADATEQIEQTVQQEETKADIETVVDETADEKAVEETKEVKAEETKAEETVEAEPEGVKSGEIKEVKAEETSATDIVLTSELDDVIVTLKADKDAFNNEGELSLVVTPVEIEDTEAEIALEAVEKENVAKRMTYDITVFDGETEIQPVKEVKVSFELKSAPSGADGVNIYHHDEETGIEKIATEVLKEDAKAVDTAGSKASDKVADKNIEIKEVDDEELAQYDDVELINDVAVDATTDSFSLYTVDFTYKDKTISIAGDTAGNKLDDIVSQLGIGEKVEEATTYQDAECTEEVANGEVKNTEGDTLFSVYEIGN